MPSMRNNDGYSLLMDTGLELDPTTASALYQPNSDGEDSRDVSVNTGCGLTATFVQRRISQRASALNCDTPSDSRRWSLCGRSIFSVVLTNVFCSILTLIVALALALGPGMYAILLHKPAIVIDKSVKSFNIPNHEATRHADALTVAKHHINLPRGKRDLTNLNHNDRKCYKNIEHLTLDNQRSFQKKIDFKKRSATASSKGGKSAGQSFYEKHFESRVKKRPAPSFVERILRRLRRSSGNLKVNFVTQSQPHWKMEVVYLAVGDDDHNVFTEERLEIIHKIEKAIVRHQGFKDYCYINYPKLNSDENLKLNGNCAPLNSLLTYFYPSLSEDGQTMHFDGLGSNIDDIPTAVERAMNHNTFFWYVDEKMNATNRKSRLLRSEVQFGSPLQGYKTNYDRRHEQESKFKEFVVTYIDMLDSQSTEKVKVLYGGNEIFDYEVDSTFWRDMLLAFISLGFIIVFMFILTSLSPWLTFWGIMSILLSFPLALFFYKVCFKKVTLGILNGAAAFVIIGIGVDDVFVFINVFRQAWHMKDLGARLKHTLFTAGKATFFTSFTTAAAFAANVASSIPAVHEFGLFMSLIVASCWIMVVFIMPPALNIWFRCFSCCERAICGRCNGGCGNTCSSLKLPQDVANFLTPTSTNISLSSSGRETASINSASTDSDDVPLLQVEDPTVEDLPDDDVPMLELERELELELAAEDSVLRQKETEGCNLTIQIQALLYHYVAIPVIHARWVIFIVFWLVFLASWSAIPLSKPAQKPPQLFKASSNLQQLLDLTANFSDSGINCNDCSGFYKESSKAVEPTTRHRWTPPASRQTAPPRRTERTTISSSRWSPQPKTTTTTHKPWRPQWKPSTAKPVTPVPPTRGPAPASTTYKNPLSVQKGQNLCSDGGCDHIQERPPMEQGVVVYVVFGIKDIDRGNETGHHVLNLNKGTVIYDTRFEEAFKTNKMNGESLKNLCKLCKLIANNTELVRPGTAQCMPYSHYGYSYPIRRLVESARYPECHDLPSDKYLNNQKLSSHSLASMTKTGLKWIAFSFESTTYKGQSYYSAYLQYQKWEKFLTELKKDLPKDSPLQGMYQTSQFWPQVFMEVVAVSSAIYGLVLSMVICTAAVAIFTGHIMLLLIVVLTILGEILLVLMLFYFVGWEMGAVEAISLSILVGSSVDYCVHLVEGYLLAGNHPPAHVKGSTKECRKWRTAAAVGHIGVSIVSSAITTIVAAIPLTQTTIQPFAKFGQIVAINTTVSIFYTLTVCTSFLAVCAPALFRNTWKSTLIATAVTGGVIGTIVLSLFVAAKSGVSIPGPSGAPLF